MICLVDLPELSRVITVEDDASRSMQRFFMEISAIYSLSCSVILLLLGNSFVVFKPVNVLVYFDHRICRDEQKERE